MSSAETATEMRAAIAALTARIERLEAERDAGHAIRKTPATRLASEATSESMVTPTVAADLESRLAGYWAARLGIVCVVTGLAFFIAHGFDRFGPVLKAASGYALAAALAGAGVWIGRRHRNLETVLVAGGLGVGYYTTYAIHHVPSVQLIASPTVGFVLLALAVAGIIAAAQKMCSETVAGLALFLGLHTGMVSDVGVFTLASGCLLAAGAGYFLARNRWVIVPISTLVAVYSTLAAYLLGDPLGPGGAAGHAADHLPTALGFAALYYATFAVAAAMAPRRLPRLAGAGFALLNWIGAAAIAAAELTHHDAGGLELIFAGLALASLAIAAVAARRHGRGDLFHLHLALATASAALAAGAAFDGAFRIAALWTVAVLATALVGPLGSPLLRIAGSAVAAIAFAAHLAAGVGSPALTGAAIAALIAIERLAPAGERATALGRFAPVCGIGLAALAAASALAPPSMITGAWVITAAAVFAAGVGLEAIHYRLVGLAIAGLAALRLFARDLAALGAAARIASFLAAGSLLLIVALVYARRASDQ